MLNLSVEFPRSSHFSSMCSLLVGMIGKRAPLERAPSSIAAGTRVMSHWQARK
jgi:hypothetical protein